MHAIGCYSVQGDIKGAMRDSELALGHAERALQMAGKTATCLESPWKTTLFNQFHDILPGSCSPAAAANAKGELDGVRGLCKDTAYTALKAISLKKRPCVREGEFRMFNTQPYPVTVPLAVESMVYYREGAAFRDDHVRLIEVQEVLPSVRAGNRKWESVDTLPAQGFTSYHFDSATTVARPVRRDVHFHECDKLAQKWSHGKSRVDVVYTRYAALPGLHAEIDVLWNEPRSILKMEMDPEGAGASTLVMQCAGGAVQRPADGKELPSRLG